MTGGDEDQPEWDPAAGVAVRDRGGDLVEPLGDDSVQAPSLLAFVVARLLALPVSAILWLPSVVLRAQARDPAARTLLDS